MPDIPDLKWLPLAEASGWFADHIGLKQGRKVLLRALADGNVLARSIRQPDRKLVAIPKGVWSSGQINWRASTVVDLPHEYQSVQVDRLQLVRLLRQPGETARSAGQPDPYRTGVPGRPSIAHLVKTEFDRRAEAGEVQATLAAEARALAEWAAKTHPKAPRITPKTIQNRIRANYRQLSTKRPKLNQQA